MGALASYRPGSLFTGLTVTVLSVAAFGSPAFAQEPPLTVPPGFRPPSEQLATFVDCLNEHVRAVPDDAATESKRRPA